MLFPFHSTTSAIAKLSKASTSGGTSKQQGEKKETPQERLKRIMSRQLNKQSMRGLSSSTLSDTGRQKKSNPKDN